MSKPNTTKNNPTPAKGGGSGKSSHREVNIPSIVADIVRLGLTCLFGASPKAKKPSSQKAKPFFAKGKAPSDADMNCLAIPLRQLGKEIVKVLAASINDEKRSSSAQQTQSGKTRLTAGVTLTEEQEKDPRNANVVAWSKVCQQWRDEWREYFWKNPKALLETRTGTDGVSRLRVRHGHGSYASHFLSRAGYVLADIKGDGVAEIEKEASKTLKARNAATAKAKAEATKARKAKTAKKKAAQAKGGTVRKVTKAELAKGAAKVAKREATPEVASEEQAA